MSHQVPIKQKSAPGALSPAPKTSAQRQQELRERRLAEGLTEVRGIYLMPHQHDILKRVARELATATERAVRITSRSPK